MTKSRVERKAEPTATTTRFTVRGSRNGSLVEITWDRGKLSGDYPTCDLVEAQAEIGATGLADPHFHDRFMQAHGELPDDPLQDPQATYRVMQVVIDSIREVESS